MGDKETGTSLILTLGIKNLNVVFLIDGLNYATSLQSLLFQQFNDIRLKNWHHLLFMPMNQPTFA